MKPTEQQIETATKLKALGFCQGAEWYILEDVENYEFFTIKIKNRKWKPVPNRVVGPLPTSAECWPEIQKLLPGLWKVVFGNGIIELVNQDDTHFILKFDDLDEAFRQALIFLAEG